MNSKGVISALRDHSMDAELGPIELSRSRLLTVNDFYARFFRWIMPGNEEL